MARVLPTEGPARREPLFDFQRAAAHCAAKLIFVTPEIKIGIIRTTAELEQLRAQWAEWGGTRDSDLDFFLTILRSGKAERRPHVLVLYADGFPRTLLVGRFERTKLNFRIGYVSLLKPSVRILTFVYGGLRGNPSVSDCDLLVRCVMDSLRNGEADAAVFEYTAVDSPFHSAATRVPGITSRDYNSAVQVHYGMELPPTMEEVYRRLSPSHRADLRRKAKRLSDSCGARLSVTRYEGLTGLGRLLGQAEEIASKTYQRALGVGFSPTPEILQRLRLSAEKGWLRGYVLSIENNPCSFWIGSVYNAVFVSEYLGYDPASERLSPGTFLLTKMLEDFCAAGIEEIDFGYGEGRYKERFGNLRRLESSVWVFAPTWKGFRLNSMRTITFGAHRMARAVLEKANMLQKVKKAWRNSLVSKQGSSGNQAGEDELQSSTMPDARKEHPAAPPAQSRRSAARVH